MLGMMFGVGAVIAMLSIGAGAEKQALALIERLGMHNVVVRGKTFTQAELQEIAQEVASACRRATSTRSKRPCPASCSSAPEVEVEPYKIIAAKRYDHGAKVFGVRRTATARSTRSRCGEGRFFDALDELTITPRCA